MKRRSFLKTACAAILGSLGLKAAPAVSETNRVTEEFEIDDAAHVMGLYQDPFDVMPTGHNFRLVAQRGSATIQSWLCFKTPDGSMGLFSRVKGGDLTLDIFPSPEDFRQTYERDNRGTIVTQHPVKQPEKEGVPYWTDTDGNLMYMESIADYDRFAQVIATDNLPLTPSANFQSRNQ